METRDKLTAVRKQNTNRNVLCFREYSNDDNFNWFSFKLGIPLPLAV